MMDCMLLVVIVAHMAPHQSQGSILSYSFVSALEKNGILQTH